MEGSRDYRNRIDREELEAYRVSLGESDGDLVIGGVSNPIELSLSAPDMGLFWTVWATLLASGMFGIGMIMYMTYGFLSSIGVV